MIKAKDIGVKYGETIALDGIDLDIAKNTSCAVLGPSGCGKATLLYTLAGLKGLSKGTLRVGGKDLDGVRKETALILQDYGLLPWKDALGNAAFALESRGLSKVAAREKAMKVLAELDVEGLAHRLPAELSSGPWDFPSSRDSLGPVAGHEPLGRSLASPRRLPALSLA